MENTNLQQRTKHFLRLYGIFPQKRLGQNFTVDPNILRRLVSYASLTKDDIVLEVGAGFGFLTQLISDECKKIVAVEVDPKLVDFLKKHLYNLKNVELIEGDILEISLPPFNKVVCTPPYSISSTLLFRLLEKSFDLAVMVLQKEFAERLVARVGSKDYGRLTVNIYYRAEVELLDAVPKHIFYPLPDVDSIMVRLKPRIYPFEVDAEETFFEVVRRLFNQRNKKVRNALIPFLRERDLTRKEAVEFADSLIYCNRRVKDLSPEDFGSLTNELVRIN